MDTAGKLFILSAPSGTGKTTLIRQILNRFKQVFYSVSHTTRLPRKGEVHGKDYFFTDKATFKTLIDSHQMLEWAKVHDNYYGTSKAFVQDQLALGNSIILDIDVQGGRQIMETDLDPVSIFIMPPSLEVLEQRLRGRGTDSDAVILTRLKNAKIEMAQHDAYTHVVINDRLEDAVTELTDIFATALGEQG
ncbi:MAG: guanylate kinase [Desulfobacterales bacterium]|nr:MAG: guanylate kinase [Desulfobacterales bacterium]